MYHPDGTAGDSCTSAVEFREMKQRMAKRRKAVKQETSDDQDSLKYHETRFGANAMVLYRKYLKLCVLVLLPIIFVVLLIFGRNKHLSL